MKGVININRLRSFFNKNKEVIIYVLLIVVFGILIIYGLNSYYKSREEENQKQVGENGVETGSNNYSNGINVTMDNIQDEETKNLEQDSIENTMKLFVNYCNTGDAVNAYNLITDECKKALKYDSADIFKEFYIDLRFKEPQEYTLLKMSTENNKTLCKITFNGDLLATGGAKFTANEEYYTFIKQEDNSYKINVNNYIYGESKNTRYVFDKIDVKIDNIDVYSRYEEITMEIQNNSDKTIAFLGYENNNSVYLVNSEETVYSSINSIFDEGDVLLEPNQTKEVTVRFNKLYSASNNATKIVFSKVILDYQDYLNTHNRTGYSNFTTIEVNYN